MPLYSCQRCGWTTTSSWRHAVPGHASCSPGCRGTVELVRYPGEHGSGSGHGREPTATILLRPGPPCGPGSAA